MNADGYIERISPVVDLTYTFRLDVGPTPIVWSERTTEVLFGVADGLSEERIVELVNEGVPIFEARVMYEDEGVDTIDLYSGDVRAARFDDVRDSYEWHAEAWDSLQHRRPSTIPCRVVASGPVEIRSAEQ